MTKDVKPEELEGHWVAGCTNETLGPDERYQDEYSPRRRHKPSKVFAAVNAQVRKELHLLWKVLGWKPWKQKDTE
jgi:hypothetical protein